MKHLKEQVAVLEKELAASQARVGAAEVARAKAQAEATKNRQELRSWTALAVLAMAYSAWLSYAPLVQKHLMSHFSPPAPVHGIVHDRPQVVAKGRTPKRKLPSGRQ